MWEMDWTGQIKLQNKNFQNIYQQCIPASSGTYITANNRNKARFFKWSLPGGEGGWEVTDLYTDIRMGGKISLIIAVTSAITKDWDIQSTVTDIFRITLDKAPSIGDIYAGG